MGYPGDILLVGDVSSTRPSFVMGWFSERCAGFDSEHLNWCPSHLGCRTCTSFDKGVWLCVEESNVETLSLHDIFTLRWRLSLVTAGASKTYKCQATKRFHSSVESRCCLGRQLSANLILCRLTENVHVIPAFILFGKFVLLTLLSLLRNYLC